MKITFMKKSGLKKQVLIHNNIYKISYDSKSDKVVFDGMENEDFPLTFFHNFSKNKKSLNQNPNLMMSNTNEWTISLWII